MKAKKPTMKKSIILLAMFILGCGVQGNEKQTIEWVKNAKKPVVCISPTTKNNYDRVKWTLIDANGNIFITAFVRYTLPDTIK